MYLNKYTAEDEEPTNVQLNIDYTVSVGSYVADMDGYDDEEQTTPM